MKQTFLIALVLMVSMTGCAQSNDKNNSKMTVAVWDTYVPRKDGKVMHFDIIAPQEIRDTAVIYNYGREYLKSKGQEGQPVTSKEVRLCHTRPVQPRWKAAIDQQGYFILELENCK